jgi:predicted dienelactone hydrolase
MKRQMAGLLIGLAVIGCALQPAWSDDSTAASPSRFRAGVTRLVVPDLEPFPALVWYPTAAGEIAWQAGEIPVAASLDAPIAEGPRFPVVLLSHGSGGSPLGHRDLATRLARDGFIVVAPTQIGDSAGRTEGRAAGRSLLDRPRQARAALDTALADPRFVSHVDPARLGMVGFSAGGYTTLVLAGARPDFVLAMAYCADHREDRGSCGNGDPAQQLSQEAAAWQPPLPPGFKAIVLMDPLAIPFDAEGLAAVRMPTLLFRPASDDYLKATRNAAALVTELPQPPLEVTVPGSHFVFLDPCPAALVETRPELCRDAPGIDRVAIHLEIEGRISDFLRRNL